MPAFSCQLPISIGDKMIYVRELSGAEEVMADAHGTPGLIAMLQRLLDVTFSDQQSIRAENIVIGERDYLLSLIYQKNYGPRILSTLRCRYCKENIDLDFPLPEWVAHVRHDRLEIGLNGEGYFLADDIQFRLPNGTDELRLMGLPSAVMEKAMFNDCVRGQVTEEQSLRVQDLMKQIAPPLSGDIETSCAECDRSQAVYFDMQSYFLARMKQERRRATTEIHAIAMTYKWSHAEILALPRSLRKRYAALIGMD